MISIVLPTFNGEKYISQSIDSIIRQSYNDWELIVVDDCSTDRTGEIAERFAEDDGRIKIIHNTENKKLPASLNIGFRKTIGEYLTWTSDDNAYEKDALSVMHNFLNVNPKIPMVCTAMNLMDEEGVVYSKYPEYDADRMYYNDIVGACFMYRRSVMESVGEYNENLFCVEDYEYWLRILERYGQIGYLDSAHYNYRMHRNSLTATKWNEIKSKLNLMRSEHFDFLFSKLLLNRKYLSGLYFDMLLTDAITNEMYYRFEKAIPEIGRVKNLPDDGKKCIIYGAGEFGDRTYHLLKDRAIFFVDRSPEKIGGQKNGLEIIDLKQARKLSDKYHIVIALESSKVLEVAEQLWNEGITDISSFQQLMSENARREEM